MMHVTMDDDQPVSISFDDTDITHVKYFKPQPSPPKTKKAKPDLQTAAATKEGFYGVNGSNSGQMVKLTYDWVASNISPAFADNLMRKYKAGGFCEIPPGNSRAEEDKAPLPDSVKTWLDSTPQDALPYQQGDSQTCVFTSFANAIHYLGLHKEVAEMNTNKEDFLKAQWQFWCREGCVHLEDTGVHGPCEATQARGG